MTGPTLVNEGASELRPALDAGQVIAVPGVGGYQLATRHGGPGVTALVALVAAGFPDVVPYFAVGRMAQADQLTSSWSDETERVAIRFWPGPVVLIVGDGEDSVRITMPARRSVRRLCRAGDPLVMVTVAGADGQPLRDPGSLCSSFSHDQVTLVVDGGTLEGPGPSLLDCRETPPVVRLEGALPRTYIEAALLVGNRRKWWSRSSG